MKNFDGQPINVLQQMDCNEFSNMFFDRLETLLKSTPQVNKTILSSYLKAKLFQNVFQGKLVKQIISKECDHKAEREEPFFTLGLEVRRQKNIYESLKLFVKVKRMLRYQLTR